MEIHTLITAGLSLLVSICLGLITWSLKSIVALREQQSELKSDLKAALAVSEERKEENNRRFEELKTEYNRRIKEVDDDNSECYHEIKAEISKVMGAVTALHERFDRRVDGKGTTNQHHN